MKKPLVLIFAACYLPGYKAGGPIRTLFNMIERLGDEFDYYLVTPDRDLGDSRAYRNIKRDCWVTVGKAKVRYLAPNQKSFYEMSKIIRQIEPDVIYLNSFFNVNFTQRILWLIRLKIVPAAPVVLAPRGEFSPGALSIKSFKKRFYISLFRWFGIYKKITWQASSSSERKDIEKIFPGLPNKNIHTAMNLAPIPNYKYEPMANKRPGQPVKVCFLSRISPIKNLDYALKVLREVKVPVSFSIYGPKSDVSYWKRCKEIVDTLPDSISVTWGGEILPENTLDVLMGHDLFFLPTRGENYGHAIHEALSAGLPVLISDQTPWGKVESLGIGWAAPLSKPELFSRAIEVVAGWDGETREAVFVAAKKYAGLVAQDPVVLQANRQLFLERLKN